MLETRVIPQLPVVYVPERVLAHQMASMPSDGQFDPGGDIPDGGEGNHL